MNENKSDKRFQLIRKMGNIIKTTERRTDEIKNRNEWNVVSTLQHEETYGYISQAAKFDKTTDIVGIVTMQVQGNSN